MPFRAQLEECTCLTPISSSTQGIRSELNSRNPVILPLRLHQKPCRSPYKLQYLGLTAAKSPSGGHVPLGAIRFQTAWRGTRTAKRQTPQNNYTIYNNRLAKSSPSPGGRCFRDHCSRRYRLAEPPPPLGATESRTPLIPCYRLAVQYPRQAPYQYYELY